MPGCIYKASETQCLYCNPFGYYMKADQTCQPVSPISNCLHQSKIVCERCRSGELTDNAFYIDFLNGDSNYDLMELFYPRYCASRNIPHCDLFDNEHNCIGCESDHYLQNGGCEKNPKEPMDNCLNFYTDYLDTCKDCEGDYFRNLSLVCEEVPNNLLVADCIKYSYDGHEIKCYECQSKNEKVPNDEGSLCVDRNVIGVCEEHIPNEEGCAICEQAYIVNPTTKNCIVSVQNCKGYDENNSCNECEDTFKIGQDWNGRIICEAGDDPNCNVYNLQGVCITCLLPYKLNTNSGRCENDRDITVSGCLEHILDEEGCEICEAGGIKVNEMNHCIKHDNIPNCDNFEDVNTCSQCHEGYGLTIQNTCEEITEEENCLRKKFTKCLECIEPYLYVLNEDETACDPVPEADTLELQCDHIKSGPKCGACSENRL